MLTIAAALTRVKATKLVIFVLASMPFVLLLWQAWREQLGANPIEHITDTTGTWALRMLVLTLLITPLRQLGNWPDLLRYRRMLGLFCFFYASLHLLTYLWLDQYFDWPFIMEDVMKHPYILVGLAAFIILLLLALTSTRGMMRRLGRNWKRLHRLVYLAALLASAHFIWLVKSDIREPLLYLALFGLLLLFRVPRVRIMLGSLTTRPG